jgi:hypothetical protein
MAEWTMDAIVELSTDESYLSGYPMKSLIRWLDGSSGYKPKTSQVVGMFETWLPALMVKRDKLDAFVGPDHKWLYGTPTGKGVGKIWKTTCKLGQAKRTLFLPIVFPDKYRFSEDDDDVKAARAHDVKRSNDFNAKAIPKLDRAPDGPKPETIKADLTDFHRSCEKLLAIDEDKYATLLRQAVKTKKSNRGALLSKLRAFDNGGIRQHFLSMKSALSGDAASKDLVTQSWILFNRYLSLRVPEILVLKTPVPSDDPFFGPLALFTNYSSYDANINIFNFGLVSLSTALAGPAGNISDDRLESDDPGNEDGDHDDDDDDGPGPPCNDPLEPDPVTGGAGDGPPLLQGAAGLPDDDWGPDDGDNADGEPQGEPQGDLWWRDDDTGFWWSAGTGPYDDDGEVLTESNVDSHFLKLSNSDESVYHMLWQNHMAYLESASGGAPEPPPPPPFVVPAHADKTPQKRAAWLLTQDQAALHRMANGLTALLFKHGDAKISLNDAADEPAVSAELEKVMPTKNLQKAVFKIAMNMLKQPLQKGSSPLGADTDGYPTTLAYERKPKAVIGQKDKHTVRSEKTDKRDAKQAAKGAWGSGRTAVERKGFDKSQDPLLAAGPKGKGTAKGSKPDAEPEGKGTAKGSKPDAEPKHERKGTAKGSKPDAEPKHKGKGGETPKGEQKRPPAKGKPSTDPAKGANHQNHKSKGKSASKDLYA